MVLNISPILPNPPNPPKPSIPPKAPPKSFILPIISFASVIRSSLEISPDSILLDNFVFTELIILPILSGFFMSLDKTSLVDVTPSISFPRDSAKSFPISSANSFANCPILPLKSDCK